MSQRITLCALVGAALLPQSLAAQEPVDHAMIARIRAEGLERSRVLALFDHLTNVIGPRLTASPAYLRSAEWARDRLREWGLEQARLEPFEFGRGWTLEQLTIELTAPRYFPVIGYPEAWTPSTRGPLEGEPLYLGDKSAAEIEALGERLRGAIVLATQPQAAFIESDRPQPADAQEGGAEAARVHPGPRRLGVVHERQHHPARPCGEGGARLHLPHRAGRRPQEQQGAPGAPTSDHHLPPPTPQSDQA